MTETIIDVESLSKYYPPDIRAVDNISFKIRSGTIFSMLGPNGAGKTTTVEILEGLRTPTAGKVTIMGEDVLKDYSKIRHRVGTLPQNFEPFDMLKPWEAVQYWAELYDIRITRKEINDLLENVGSSERKNLYSKKLSGGERRKLGIALSIVNNPELLFLDEPTTGLDPKARRDVWELIANIRDRGTTTFLTTHYLDEAEKLADEVAIMHKGRIIANGAPGNLIESYGSGTVIVLENAGMTGLSRLKEMDIDAKIDDVNPNDVIVAVKKHSEMMDMMSRLASSGIQVNDIYTRRETLEDVFLNLVGSRMEDGVLRQ